jgi:phosphoglycerate dehydrogenase-like enzyme
MTAGILVSDRVVSDAGPALREAAGDFSLLVLRPGAMLADPERAQIAYFSGDLFPARAREFVLALAKAEGLRWLHVFSAGVDHPWFQQLLARGVRITTSSGASAVPIAQTVTLYLLALSRDLRSWSDAQQRKAWEPHDIVDLQQQVLGVLGMGPIGREVARLGTALRMRVVGMTRSPKGDEPCETWPLSRLRELLPLVDWIVLALPLTSETRGILSADAIARMKPGACVLNVGRGDLVDEPALVKALESGALGGAGLDVFAEEPLPPESPLWGLPNVIVTPHSSGTTPANHPRATAIFVENLRRWRKGEALVNEVVPD